MFFLLGAGEMEEESEASWAGSVLFEHGERGGVREGGGDGAHRRRKGVCRGVKTFFRGLKVLSQKVTRLEEL